LRSQIGLVEQDVFLFSKSIKENILLGLPSASDEEIIKAAKLAQAHEFISKFPDGYETIIGERGITLSGGQRQRVAIARAVLKNPSILILDDATSAIDSQTEDEINTAIKNVLEGRVSFLITHRISQIRRADLIVLIDRGMVIGLGKHETLLLDSPKYQSIFTTFDDFDLKTAVEAAVVSKQGVS
jgi:ATP-binding cassette subfamily B protein